MDSSKTEDLLAQLLKQYQGKPEPVRKSLTDDDMFPESFGFDSVGMDDESCVNSSRIDAMSAVHGWLDSDDLDVGEGEGDRLMGVMMAAVHGDTDGSRLTAEQSEHFDMIREEAGHYLLSLGADEDDIHAALNDWEDDAAENIRHAVSGVEMDSVGYYLDATREKPTRGYKSHLTKIANRNKAERANGGHTYKTVAVVRDSQKVFVKKRTSGTVHLTSKQKAALKKGRHKVWTSAMKLKLSKSMKYSYNSGLHGKSHAADTGI
jgi:hypothetical protein